MRIEKDSNGWTRRGREAFTVLLKPKRANYNFLLVAKHFQTAFYPLPSIDQKAAAARARMKTLKCLSPEIAKAIQACLVMNC